MDEGEVADEVARLDAPFQSKDNEYFLRPEGGSLLESQNTTIPSEGNCPDSSTRSLADIRQGRDVCGSIDSVDASDHPCGSPRSLDGIGGMVEELTVKNYGSSNLAIVGTSSSREGTQTRQTRWQHLYQLGSGSGSRFETMCTNNAQGLSSDPDISSPKILPQNPSSVDCNEVHQQVNNTEIRNLDLNALPPGAIRTKILSKSGFPEFYVKNTLKGKGVIRKSQSPNRNYANSGDPSGPKACTGNVEVSDIPLNLRLKTSIPSSLVTAESRPVSANDGITLREWLKSGQNKVNKIQRLYIFKQIVELVDRAHSEGVVFRDLCPLCFKLLPLDEVRYIGSSLQGEMLETESIKDFPRLHNSANGKRTSEKENFSLSIGKAKMQKLDENINFTKQWSQLYSRFNVRARATDVSSHNLTHSQNEDNIHHTSAGSWVQDKSAHPLMTKTTQWQLTGLSDEMEKWYKSPEELTERGGTMASNVYCLGVLLFELLGKFESGRAHCTAMSDLHHRILPPNFLSEHPKEAGFCLWLLHPEPSSRPTTREILQSEVISGLQDICTQDLSLSIERDDAESELLLHFLASMQEKKQKYSSMLEDEIRCLETDIQEIEKRRRPLLHSGDLSSSPSSNKKALTCKKTSNSHAHTELDQISSENKSRLMKNISQLESAYFSVRSKIQRTESNVIVRSDREPLRQREIWCSMQNDENNQASKDCLGAFFDGFCKYARHTKFKVRGVLRSGDFTNSANVICSLSFNRDEDYFAAAGVSKKIKVYEFNSLFSDSVDVHYPVMEMPNKSKLSCICWNSYIRNHLASTDYDGVVKVWDASTGQVFSQYTEHQKRAWSVDFSQVDPTKLASGSDDGSVKLWGINEKKCLDTIMAIANVCCVQFSNYSSNLLAFGSADYKIYCFDLRNVKNPWCILGGHDKAVSYVKFLDPETIVSASTDNSLKIWDLNKTNPAGTSNSACSLTLSGHTNEKNFVGLSVSDGYITCGSETNEVYAYHKSLPMPITSHKFGSIDPISGKETEDDNGQFVSSVCWKGKSDMAIAANSSGCIKALQMV